MISASATTTMCRHCGSSDVQEARRGPEGITYRCLHCWKTFTRAIIERFVAAPADS